MSRGRQQGLPSPLGIKDPVTQQFLWAVKERLENSSLVQQELARFRAELKAVADEELSPGLAVRPRAIENLSTTGIFNGIMVLVDAIPAEAAGMEVWAAEVNDLGQAMLVGFSRSRMWTHMLGGGEERYYWVRGVSKGDIDLKGPFNDTVGTYGKSKLSREYILNEIEGQLTESHLDDFLRANIDLITGDEDGSVNQRVQSALDEINQAKNDLTQQISDAKGELEGDIDDVRQAGIDERANLSDRLADARRAASLMWDEIMGIDLIEAPGITLSPATGVVLTQRSIDEVRHTVDAQEGELVSQSAKIFAAENRITSAEERVSAHSLVIDQVLSDVSLIDGEVQSSSSKITALQNVVTMLQDTGAVNLLGGTAESEQQDKVEIVPIDGTGLEPGSVVSAYGELRHEEGDSQNFYIAALDASQNEIGRKESLGAGGEEVYEAAKVQGFELPEGTEYLAVGFDGAGASLYGRHYSLNTGPLAVVFYGGTATAEALAALSSEVRNNKDLISANTQEITDIRTIYQDPETGFLALSQALSQLSSALEITDGEVLLNAQSIEAINAVLDDPETGLGASFTAINDLFGRATQNESEISSVSGSVTQVESQLSSLSGQVGSNTLQIGAHSGAISSLTSRVSSNESEISSTVSDLRSLESVVNNPESGLGATASSLSTLESRVTQTESELGTQSQSLVALDDRINAVKLGEEYGFESGASGQSGAPKGWALKGTNLAKYSDNVASSSSFGSRLSYGVETGAPGGWSLSRSFEVSDGGGQFGASLYANVINGSAYAALIARDLKGNLIKEIYSSVKSAPFKGEITVAGEIPEGARYVDLYLVASRLN